VSDCNGIAVPNHASFCNHGYSPSFDGHWLTAVDMTMSDSCCTTPHCLGCRELGADAVRCGTPPGRRSLGLERTDCSLLAGLEGAESDNDWHGYCSLPSGLEGAESDNDWRGYCSLLSGLEGAESDNDWRGYCSLPSGLEGAESDNDWRG
jgi:hypothetical protein